MTDIGIRVIVAIRIDRVAVAVIARKATPIPARVVAVEGDQVDVVLTPKPDRVLNQAEAETEGWFHGPPYAVAEQVFDENDMKGCIQVFSDH